MKTASTVELKTHLGRYLGLVSRGETIVVTSHRHPVARLVRPAGDPGHLEIPHPRRLASHLDGLGPVQLARPSDGVGSLLRDRQRR
jgi:antitoxin (DNA-binding transcriptional repressor) of toxin-antitoxin stability system